MEQWKQVVIDGEPWDYEVSDLGNVRNIETGKMLKHILTRKGYSQVGLYKDRKLKKMYVHRLVAQAFIPNPNNLSEVNHKNEIKTDNMVENLEWMTHKNNVNYGTRTKRATKVISKKVMAISLTENKVLVFQSMSQAHRFGFNKGHIYECCNGKYGKNKNEYKGYKWKYIEG